MGIFQLKTGGIHEKRTIIEDRHEIEKNFLSLTAKIITCISERGKFLQKVGNIRLAELIKRLFDKQQVFEFNLIKIGNN